LSTTRNAIWLTACRLTGDVLNLLLFVLISRRFGPGGAGLHSTEEYVNVADVLLCRDALAALARRFC